MNNERSDGLTVRLLGSFEVYRGDTPIKGLDGTLARTLFSYLVCQRHRTLSRSHLADLFWPESSRQSARNSLRQLLHHLRGCLDSPDHGAGPLLSATRETVRLNPAHTMWIDVEALQQRTPPRGRTVGMMGRAAEHTHLLGIVDLYRGPFLNNTALEHLSPSAADWILSQRIAKRHIARDALDQSITCLHLAEHAVEPAETLRAIRIYLDAEPLDESAYRALMRLLMEMSRHDEAIESYHRLEKALRLELDSVPEEVTTRLYNRIVATRTHHRFQDDASEDGWQLERRLITALGIRVDFSAETPEEQRMAGIIDFFKRLEGLVAPYGGLLSADRGNTALVYFGHHRSSDRATLRAVRAAVRITTQRPPPRGACLRVAVHSLQMITETSLRVLDPTGVLSSSVLRLCNVSPAGRCVITAEVFDRVRAHFEAEPLPEPLNALTVYQIRLDRQAWRGIDALRPVHQQVPLIGRSKELSELAALWRSATCKQGKIAVLEGDPGVGKSRLVGSLMDTVHAQGGLALPIVCQMETITHPLHPLRELCRDALEAQRHDKDHADSNDVARNIAEGLSIPKERYTSLLAGLATTNDMSILRLLAPGMDPISARDWVIQEILALLRDIAAQIPVLFIVEDFQWVDSLTQMLCARLSRQRSPGVFLLIVSRPSGVHQWNGQSPDQHFFLEPLDEWESRELSTAIDEDISSDAQARILTRAEGIPLFIEALHRHYRSGERDVDVPTGLQEILAARSDTLPQAAYALAQLAACIGREFERPLLASASVLDGEEIDRAITVLQNANILRCDVNQSESQVKYRFQHALIRDAIYTRQLSRDRINAHERIVEILQQRYAQATTCSPEVLAHHLQCAGQYDQAVPLLLQAGERLLQQAAHREAHTQFVRALEILRPQTPSEAGRSLLLSTYIGLGLAKIGLLGYGSRAAYETFASAAALESPGDDPDQRFLIRWLQWQSASSYAGFSHAQKLADAMQQAAEHYDDRCMEIASRYAQINTCYSQGRLAAAEHHLEVLGGIYDPSDHSTLIARFGEDSGLSGYSFGCLVLWHRGRTQEAWQLSEKALALANHTRHSLTQAFCYTFRALLDVLNDDPQAVCCHMERVRVIAERGDYHLWRTAADALECWAMLRQGERSDVDSLSRAVDDFCSLMYGTSTILQRLLIDALVFEGDWERAQVETDRAFGDVKRIGNDVFLPELYRRQGEILAHDCRHEDALQAFRRAGGIAGEQGAVLENLRTQLAILDSGLVHASDPRFQRELETLLNDMSSDADIELVARGWELIADSYSLSR